MNHISKAIIISYNIDNEALCASAARISTTEGDAIDIFEKSKENENNSKLIQRVLQSGHHSIMEHAVFTIAFQNVSAFVEQFFIESRLASFTVKSRRYVDFTKQGYFIPYDLDDSEKDSYCRYMDILFESYQNLLTYGIPKEDARFILPYSFNSNFYCTLNARELVHLIHSIRHGRGKSIPELISLANQISDQLAVLAPSIISAIDLLRINDDLKFDCNDSQLTLSDRVDFLTSDKIGAVELINVPKNPLDLLILANQIVCNEKTVNLKHIIKDNRPRALEQLSYTFTISNITLSCITHIVRHRMQSIIIPKIQSVDFNKCIIPNTILQNDLACDEYKREINQTHLMLKNLNENRMLNKYSYYFALSGNVLDVMTTMNARELMLFLRLRTCNRAQWEIRDVAIDLLRKLRLHFPDLFNEFGPSCYIEGKCPEGRMTCGKYNDVIKVFKNECEDISQ